MAEDREDDGKKKKKVKVKAPSTALARGKWKSSRPDLRRKVLRIVHSNTVDEAKAFIAKVEKDMKDQIGIGSSLTRLIQPAELKKLKAKERKINRNKDPEIIRRRTESRHARLKDHILQVSKAIKERKDVEARIRDAQADNPQDPADPYLVDWLCKTPDYPELHAKRLKLKEKLEGIEQALSRMS